MEARTAVPEAGPREPSSHAHPPLLSVGGATHWPEGLQTAGPTQSSTELHEVLQPFLQMYGLQSCDGPFGGCAVWLSMHVVAGKQLPLMQVNPATQSESAAHVVLHLVPSAVHAKCSVHGFVATATQSPCPLQLLSVSAAAVQLEPHAEVG